MVKRTSLGTRLWRSTARELGIQTVVLLAAAGTLAYWQAWATMGLRLVPIVATNLYLVRKDPALLERRLAIEEEGEKEGVHKLFFALIRLFGLALFCVAGLDRRYGWSAVPLPLVLAGCLAVAGGGFVIFRVFRENTYCSSVVELREGQTVVATGPYRLVRHPMYTGALLAIAAMPLALGSYAAAIFVLPLCAVFMMRIRAEEKFLAVELPGYAAYMAGTRKRLVPGVW
jgi:protein-S-isoprenylcysteine O-methyltransferase Ste14